MNEPIIIDPEFKSIIPPLSDDEYKQLEENCKRDGILDSLKVWHGILIDGHNRYRISEDWDLNYRTEEMDFSDRDAVMRWIILNQFGRRNLSAYDRGILALKLKPMIAKKAEENLHLSKGKGCQKSDKVKTIDTKKELAQVAGVSHDTIHKVETIENSGNKKLIAQVQSGKKSIHQAYNEIKNKEIDRLPTAQEYREEVQKRHDDFGESTIATIDDIQQEKRDKEFLGEQVRRDIANALKKVFELYVQISEKDTDVSLLTGSGKKRALADLEEASREIETIIGKIKESR